MIKVCVDRKAPLASLPGLKTLRVPRTPSCWLLVARASFFRKTQNYLLTSSPPVSLHPFRWLCDGEDFDSSESFYIRNLNYY
jgi:hypothetical protein